ncbi:restriction endonuclease subunit S [Tenacibaculum piscium]|uniref:restriction endonuclease subunit S n=1 Tax=Tenacibaculum piscium TaxID=1458515 RepID=UPI001EFB6157|nr:restriction endonuclease subunit S [Tenacibaculum piscium]MCG8182398.1 restriction endonuclease subunit S [Tenacibaculum piscium]MCG8203790.1 restriction endonuclease subunit S [Tenacibaculum piscium]
MKSNYKLLGDYITTVNLRNKDLKTTNLKGLSMTKEFRKSTSNIIGVDLSKYKLVPKNHFACDFMSVIRVHKLPVVHQNSDELIIVSPAYTVFKVIDENILNPEYLMMWFRRPEFDRYADFRCDSAIRGGFKWDELGEVELPIPSIEKQHEIVKEYNTVANRITLNEAINKKLEDTAQALYKNWFVDFEFPNEQGKPYKSNGGKMVYNEELDLEIPLGWENGCLGDLSNQFSGFSFKGDEYSFDKGISVVRGENVTEQKLRWNTHKKWYLQLEERMKKCFLKANDIVIAMDGSKVGKNWSLISEYELPLLLAQRVTSVRGIRENQSIYIYYSMLVMDFQNYVSQVQTGTSIPHISGSQISEFPMLIPDNSILEMFNNYLKSVIKKSYLNTQLNKTLENFKDLLLSKMSKVAIEKEMVC